MKKRTRDSILKNLQQLAETTDCNDLFLAIISGQLNLPAEEIENLKTIRETKGNITAAKRFYENLIKHNTDERRLTEILYETRQSGAYHILTSFHRTIRFDVELPITSFVGREEELKYLMDELTAVVSENNYITVVSQISTLVGIGGIGKTELCRKFLSNVNNTEMNIVWFNADNEGTINNSFRNLAKILYIRTYTNDGEERDIHAIVQEVFHELEDLETIFVYDNCDNPILLQDGRYWPNLQLKQFKPKILITSRNCRWPNIAKILTVDKLKLEDAINLVATQLQKAAISDSFDQSMLQKLVELLQCFPLAIQQAIAYIIQENFCSSYTIENYISDFTKKASDFLASTDFQGIDCTYTKTTYTTWRVTIDRLLEEGKVDNDGIQILHIIGYLDPDFIQLNIFDSCNISSQDLEKIFDHFQAYSLLTFEKTKDTISIHRLFQQVIRLELQTANSHTSVTRLALQLIQRNDKSRTPLHATAAWRHCYDNPNILGEFFESAVYTEKQLTPLHLLVQDGDVSRIKSILNLVKTEHSYLDVTDGFNRTALFIAASLGHSDIIKELAEGGASTNIKSTICFSAFDNLGFNVYDPTKRNALHIAAYYDRVDAVGTLVHINPNLLNEQDRRYQTPPLVAVLVGNVQSVKIMKMDNPMFGVCALMTNIVNGHDEIAELEQALEQIDKPKEMLNKRLVQNNSSCFWFVFTPIRIAAHIKAGIDIFYLLEKYGAKLFSRDGDYRELLFLCGLRDNGPLAIHILSRVKNPDLQIVNDNWTILHNCCKNGALDVLRHIIENYFVNVNVKDRHWDTPLYQAAYNGHLETVRYLVEHGADVNIVNKLGCTPIIAAAVNYKLDVVKYLIDVDQTKLFPWETEQEKETIVGGMQIGLLQMLISYDEAELLEYVIKIMDGKGIILRMKRNTNCLDSSAMSLLHAAALFNSVKCTRFLLDNLHPTAFEEKLNLLNCSQVIYNAAQKIDFDIKYQGAINLLVSVCKLLPKRVFALNPAQFSVLLGIEINQELKDTTASYKPSRLLTFVMSYFPQVKEMIMHFREYLAVQKNPELQAGKELTALVNLFRREA